MGIWNKLFGKNETGKKGAAAQTSSGKGQNENVNLSKNKPTTTEEEINVEAKKKDTGNKQSTTKTFSEKDNMGSRHDTLSLATSYWMARIVSPKKDPFVMYTFDNANNAREALLELPCIHVAEDSNKLICTEVLIFGYYQADDGKYEAVICGDDLTHELWEQAKNSFAKHGGTLKNDLEPQQKSALSQSPKAKQPDKVVFVREDRQQRTEGTMIYRIHKAPNAASAQAFLQQNPVTRNFYYIVVETSEGNYCRNIQGIYKE
jgi:hypothetical protein